MHIVRLIKALELNEDPRTVFKTFCEDSHNPVGKFLCDLVDFVLELFPDVDPKISPDVTCKQLAVRSRTEGREGNGRIREEGVVV